MEENNRPTFEEKLARVEEIARELSSGSSALGESLALYEEGKGLIKELEGELEAVRERVRILNSDGSEEDYL